METVFCNVRDLAQNDRSTLERVVGRQLRGGQQLIIQVMNLADDQPTGVPAMASGELPDWCNVYAGLSDREIDDLDQAITRPSTRLKQPPTQ